jgi:nucleoside-diphosphate-sugar epimerase
MKYFLTGATGFLGGRVARQLREARHDVIALVRNLEKAKDLAGLGVQLAKGDVTDKESMRAPLTGVDGVFHVAAWYKIGVKDKTPGAAVNIDGTRNVLELMKELKIPKGVYTSTLAVNSSTHGKLVDESYRFTGKHLSEYDRTKAAAHAVAEQFIRDGLPLVIVQPGLIYGPGDTSTLHDFLVNYLKRRIPMMPQQTAHTWGHVDDIARGHILAMEKGKLGENYYICGPAHTSIEAVQLAEQITGIPGPRQTASPGMFMAMSGLMGVIERIVPVPNIYSSEYLRVAAGVTYLGNNAKARRELGWEPRALKDGLPETLQWEMQQLGMR